MANPANNDVTDELVGLPVFDPLRLRLLGYVKESIRNPASGVLLGLRLLFLSGNECVIDSQQCHILGDVKAILVSQRLLDDGGLRQGEEKFELRHA